MTPAIRHRPLRVVAARSACAILVLTLVAAPATTQTRTSTTTTTTTITRTPTEVARTMRQAGSSATETLRVLATELRADTRTATRALRDAGYSTPQMIEGFHGTRGEYGPEGRYGGQPITELVVAGEPIPAVSGAAVSIYAMSALQLATELKAAGATASAVAAGLAAGGFTIRVIAQTLKGVGFTADQVAVALAERGLALAQVGDELIAVGFALNETVTALVQRFGPVAAPIAAWLKASAMTAQAAGLALRAAGFTSTVAAAALREVGYAAAGIGAGLVEYGETVESVAAALHAAGATPNELAEFLLERNRSAADAAKVLAQQLYLPLRDVLSATIQVYKIELAEAFAKAGSYYPFEVQAEALRELGATADNAATWLKAKGAKAAQVFGVLQSRWSQTAAAATKTLRTAGYTAAEVARGIEKTQSGMMLSMMQMMSLMMGAGFGGSEIATAVAPIFNVTVEAVQAALATITP